MQSDLKLSIAMAAYEDADGVYFTIQSMRMQSELAKKAQIVVVDNCPKGKQSAVTKRHCLKTGAEYHPYENRGSAAAKDESIRKCTGDIVIVVDPHVLLQTGTIESVMEFFTNQKSKIPILLQGPNLCDDLETIQTHWLPVWSNAMLGQWGRDPQYDNGKPFPIGMQGMGFFAFRRKDWPGFNPNFIGFGGEEFYIHEKYKKMGGRVMCHPKCLWVHRFERAESGQPYPNVLEERLFNYFLGFMELNLNTDSIFIEFAKKLPAENICKVFAEAYSKHQETVAIINGHKLAENKMKEVETRKETEP